MGATAITRMWMERNWGTMFVPNTRLAATIDKTYITYQWRGESWSDHFLIDSHGAVQVKDRKDGIRFYIGDNHNNDENFDILTSSGPVFDFIPNGIRWDYGDKTAFGHLFPQGAEFVKFTFDERDKKHPFNDDVNLHGTTMTIDLSPDVDGKAIKKMNIIPSVKKITIKVQDATRLTQDFFDNIYVKDGVQVALDLRDTGGSDFNISDLKKMTFYTGLKAAVKGETTTEYIKSWFKNLNVNSITFSNRMEVKHIPAKNKYIMTF